MPVVYSGTCPYDLEVELKNFKRQQTVFEAAWRLTSDPQVLRDALLHAQAAGRIRAYLIPDWLVDALSNTLMKGRTGKRHRTGQTPKRFWERTYDVLRYCYVRNLRQKGYTVDDALDLAVAALEGKGNSRPRIEAVYEKVRRDLDRKRHESEYWLLVVSADPTVVPVHVVQRPDGATVINGVTFKSQG